MMIEDLCGILCIRQRTCFQGGGVMIRQGKRKNKHPATPLLRSGRMSFL